MELQQLHQHPWLLPLLSGTISSGSRHRGGRKLRFCFWRHKLWWVVDNNAANDSSPFTKRCKPATPCKPQFSCSRWRQESRMTSLSSNTTPLFYLKVMHVAPRHIVTAIDRPLSHAGEPIYYWLGTAIGSYSGRKSFRQKKQNAKSKPSPVTTQVPVPVPEPVIPAMDTRWINRIQSTPKSHRIAEIMLKLSLHHFWSFCATPWVLWCSNYTPHTLKWDRVHKNWSNFRSQKMCRWYSTRCCCERNCREKDVPLSKSKVWSLFKKYNQNIEDILSGGIRNEKWGRVGRPRLDGQNPKK